MPKTDPEIVIQNAKNYLDRISKTKEYQEALELYEAEEKYNFYELTSLGITSWSGLALAFLSEKWYWASMTHRVVVWSGVVIFLCSIVLWMFFTIKEFYCKKGREAYEKSIDEERKRYTLKSNEIVFQPDLIGEDSFWNPEVLRVIQCLKEWPKSEDASYVIVPDPITQLSGNPRYVSYNLCQCVSGKVEHYVELNWFWFDKEAMDRATKCPGVIDLSFMDEKIWYEQTPYYENSAYSES